MSFTFRVFFADLVGYIPDGQSWLAVMPDARAETGHRQHTPYFAYLKSQGPTQTASDTVRDFGRAWGLVLNKEKILIPNVKMNPNAGNDVTVS